MSTITIIKGWERVGDHIDDAILIAWDECHKIYLAMDATEADWFRNSSYTIVEGTSDEMTKTLHKWWDESCFLRFISAVSHNPINPNAGFVDLIPQGADDEDYEDDEEEWD